MICLFPSMGGGSGGIAARAKKKWLGGHFLFDIRSYSIYISYRVGRGEVRRGGIRRGEDFFMINGNKSKWKPWTVRMPKKLLDWLREQAARETIRQGKSVSMNEFIVGVLDRFKKDKK